MKKQHTLIVGGTRGTGRIVVRTLAEAGHVVSVIGRRAPSTQDIGVPNVGYWAVDILDRDRCAAVLDEIVQQKGRLNHLVFLQRFRGDDDGWTGEIQTSLAATKEMIERLADEFDDSGDKAIVIVGSIASQFVADEQPVGYHVAKAGLLQMVRYYAVALGAKGIRVNCVSPGTILKEESKDFYLGNDELQNLYKTIIPLRRMGTSQDVANVIEFLCSPKASYLSGQDIVVDGGLSVQGHESMARRLTLPRDRGVVSKPEKSIK